MGDRIAFIEACGKDLWGPEEKFDTIQE